MSREAIEKKELLSAFVTIRACNPMILPEEARLNCSAFISYFLLFGFCRFSRHERPKGRGSAMIRHHLPGGGARLVLWLARIRHKFTGLEPQNLVLKLGFVTGSGVADFRADRVELGLAEFDE